MGRWTVTKQVLRNTTPKYNTPVNNILLISAFSLLALVLSLTLVASFINFGAFLAFTCLCAPLCYFLLFYQEKTTFC